MATPKKKPTYKVDPNIHVTTEMLTPEIAASLLEHNAKNRRMKVKNIQANPKVCFEVDSGEPIEGDDPCDYSWAYRSVIADGNARILENPGDKLNALRILCDKYAPGEGQKLNLDKITKFKDLRVIEIIVEKMTGKKSTPTPSANTGSSNEKTVT